MQKDINNLVITRINPLLIVFMIDQSASMNDKFGNAPFSKAVALSKAINDILYEMGLKSMSNGEIVSRFEVGLFAYAENSVRSGWEGNLNNKFIHTIRNIFNNPLSIRNDETLEWISSHGNGGTPMLSAFHNVKDLIEDWINWGEHSRICHPPIIINISDGEATDDNADYSGIRNIVNEIKQLKTEYGPTVVMNIHISGESYDKILFPNKPVGKNPYQKLLFDISSPLYRRIIDRAKEHGYNVQDDARGYVYNGDTADLLHFLNIGTQSASDR